MGDFNLQLGNIILTSFLGSNNLTNLIKSNTCFKCKGSSIDLILTNRKYSFKGAEATCVEMTAEMKKCCRLKDMLNFNII